MKPINNKEIKEYLDGLSNEQKSTVLKIREAVLSADIRVKEGIKWGSIAFFNHKNICGYRVAKAHITLLFMEGASLEDKFNILNGSGVKARTYKVSFEEEIAVEALQDLVLQSLAFKL